MTTVQELPTATFGTVSIAGTLKADDSGRLLIHLRGNCDKDECEHIVTIGAADGNDALTPETTAVQATVQTALDNARTHIQKILSARAAVRSIASQLR